MNSTDRRTYWKGYRIDRKTREPLFAAIPQEV
jgi:hypothetical protein